MRTGSEPNELYINDANELLVGGRDEFICESYIFEPAPEERDLGHLYIVGETKNMDGAGTELLETVVQALQREYYRDPKRNMLSGFESALHQANLVLHDTAERGWREWMQHFHVAVAAVAGQWVHVSAAGLAGIYIVRSGQVVEATDSLAEEVITHPLRSFGQVASGKISNYDVLYLGTPAMMNIYRPQDLLRFAEERSSAEISNKMRQLYQDQGANVPLSTVVVSILPRHKASVPVTVSQDQNVNVTDKQRQRGVQTSLQPRRPLQIKKSIGKTVLILIVRGIVVSGHWILTKAAPLMGRLLRRGGNAMGSASRNSGTKLQSAWLRIRHKEKKVRQETTLPKRSLLESLKAVITMPIRLILLGLARLYSLPRTSKIFGVVAILLAIALGTSIVLLKDKKTEDASIQRASELLYQAQTQHDAAETALIYDNREQATKLLVDAESSLAEVRNLGAYENEVETLAQQITDIQDRLQKITHAGSLETKTIGDFGSILGTETLTSLEFINGAAYTFSPKDNTIVRLSTNGEPDVVSRNTPGIGYIQKTITQSADKTIVYLTDAPGMASLDTKDGNFSSQSINFPSSEPNIQAMAAYSNRLYVYDATANNIFSYSKTLSGYSGGVAWIEDQNFVSSGIVSMTIDGSIYTLHEDGSVHELFKGQALDFTLDEVSPGLAGADKIMTQEDSNYLYIFDRINKRVVIFSKKGQLKQQIFLDSLNNVRDVALAPDENSLYVLSGTQVLQVPIQAVAE